MSALVLVPLAAQQASDSQDATPAPSGVEASVRKRALDFYSLQSESKFRQAEAFVCEDSKDKYYNSQKQKWLSVNIIGVRLEDQDQKALVSMALETMQNTMAGPFHVTMPLVTYWRAEGDSWCLFYPEPESAGRKTPFGVMSPGDPGDKTKKSLQITPVSPDAIMQGVKASRQQLHLNGRATSSDQIEIKNTLPGIVDLELSQVKVPGLKLTLSASQLKANETAILKAEFNPSDKRELRSVKTKVVVQPLGHEIPIAISFDAQPQN